jgi:hypothetical protein
VFPSLGVLVALGPVPPLSLVPPPPLLGWGLGLPLSPPPPPPHAASMTVKVVAQNSAALNLMAAVLFTCGRAHNPLDGLHA